MNQQLVNTISTYMNQGNFSEAFKILADNEASHQQDAQYWEMLALAHGMSGNNVGCRDECRL